MNVQSFFLKVLFIAIFAFELSYFCNVCLFNTVFMRVIVMPLETLQPAERFVTIFAIEGLIVFSCRVGVSLFCTFEICGADFALMKKTTIGTCLKRYSERNSSELVVHYMNSQTFHTVINNMSFQANFRKISLATVLAHKSLIMRSPSWLLWDSPMLKNVLGYTINLVITAHWVIAAVSFCGFHLLPVNLMDVCMINKHHTI